MKDRPDPQPKDRKKPWRILFIACAVLGVLMLLGELAPRGICFFLGVDAMFSPSEGTSIGVIGGADGPTAIFVTAPAWSAYILPSILLAVGVVGLICVGRPKKG